ncbi:MAG: hypothetical protein ACWGQW_02260 [bacterium]
MSEDIVKTARQYKIISILVFHATLLFAAIAPWVVVAFFDKWYLIPVASTVALGLWIISGLAMVNRNLQVEAAKQKVFNEALEDGITRLLGQEAANDDEDE